MDRCPLCGHMTAERNHYTDKLVCYNKSCEYDEHDLEQENLIPLEHKSLDTERINRQGGELEKAFAIAWEKRNSGDSHMFNFGMGCLQDLMVRQDKGNQVEFWITQREATIVATVIQWLGTNVGLGFLLEVFDEVGFQLKTTHRRTISQEPIPTTRQLMYVKES